MGLARSPGDHTSRPPETFRTRTLTQRTHSEKPSPCRVTRVGIGYREWPHPTSNEARHLKSRTVPTPASEAPCVDTKNHFSGPVQRLGVTPGEQRMSRRCSHWQAVTAAPASSLKLARTSEYMSGHPRTGCSLVSLQTGPATPGTPTLARFTGYETFPNSPPWVLPLTTLGKPKPSFDWCMTDAVGDLLHAQYRLSILLWKAGAAHRQPTAHNSHVRRFQRRVAAGSTRPRPAHLGPIPGVHGR